MSNPTERPLAAVFGCAGPELLPEEAAFFGKAQPFGFILFARNCETPAQVARLTAALRASIGRPDAPVLIDEEGGRVQRLKPPQWRDAPAAARFGEIAETDIARAEAACRLNARLIAYELASIGVDVDCLPCLDLFHAPGSPAIATRSFSADPEVVIRLGRAQVAGLQAGGVLPIMKHLPGHGRADVDTHLALPTLEEDLDTLLSTDIRPFKALSGLPMAMTAHIVFRAMDPQRPATQSPTVIAELIRGEIGFQGILFTDDIGMQALSGDFAERSARALEAGCDIVLHCSGAMDEMRQVVGGSRAVSEEVWNQWRSLRTARPDTEDLNWEEGLAELSRLMPQSARN